MMNAQKRFLVILRAAFVCTERSNVNVNKFVFWC